VENVRPDGSWPIDTNLATWATTLAVKSGVTGYDRAKLLDWLLDQQYKEIHPFTNSPPGGWAWTDLTGGVPDADDTPGAMLALRELMDSSRFQACHSAAENGASWLLDLQNHDGGIPTFCKGWGTLPFDRSSPDLTAHTLRAWMAWYDDFDENLRERIDRGVASGLDFLKRTQHRDGSWIPLWFGNQYRSRDEENPTYGTTMVCRALEVLPRTGQVETMLERGLEWLSRNQNSDGGWGGGLGTPSSIEETALAIGALAKNAGIQTKTASSIEKGFAWLIDATENGTQFPASPIGFYFAKLWYFERLYPIVWTVEAVNRVR
jgi:squalene-hopene/tetraprenyl-beta-curcumene cyclase